MSCDVSKVLSTFSDCSLDIQMQGTRYEWLILETVMVLFPVLFSLQAIVNFMFTNVSRTSIQFCVKPRSWHRKRFANTQHIRCENHADFLQLCDPDIIFFIDQLTAGSLGGEYQCQLLHELWFCGVNDSISLEMTGTLASIRVMSQSRFIISQLGQSKRTDTLVPNQLNTKVMQTCTQLMACTSLAWRGPWAYPQLCPKDDLAQVGLSG